MSGEAEFAADLGLVWRRWRARLDERLRDTGLTQARWMPLLRLAKAGPISQRELAELVGVEGPTLVRTLDHLEKQGLVERCACDGDRRVKLVHLTDTSKPLLEEITRIAADLRREVLGDVPPADLATAHGVLRRIADRLDRSE